MKKQSLQSRTDNIFAVVIVVITLNIDVDEESGISLVVVISP
jgi:uncharacterized membrane protein